jgi:dTDP-4-amino-4,6-dideoxygalactose transaminase
VTPNPIKYTEPAKLECSVSLIARLHDILDSGNYTSNKFTKQFEDSFKEQFSLKGQCIAVNGCQNGLFLVLVALGIHRPLIPDFTFCSTAHAAFYACRDFKVGDCDSRTWNLEPRVSPERDCIIGTHIFGNPCGCSQIQEVADELQVPVIYDAAHAIGATYKGTSIGDLGTASVFSLSQTKALTSCEGGMIVTSNQCLADKLKNLRNYGNESDYDCKVPGLNARMSEIHACFGLESLHNFPENFSKRMSLVQEYCSELPPEMLQQPNPEGTHAYKDFAILLGSKREKVQRALTEKGIEYRIYFRPISALSCYEGWQVPQPNARAVFNSILQLPLHPNLETEDIRRICKVVLSVIGEDVQGRGEGYVHGLASTVQQADSLDVSQGGGRGSK